MFKRREHLEEHKKCHLGQRDHACDVCGMKFIFKHHLTIHMRRHNGEKPFACPSCSFTAATQDNVNMHILPIHSGVKEHVCVFPLCGREFVVTSWELDYHYDRWHSEDAIARHKIEEMKIVRLLDAHGFNYKREHRINASCAIKDSMYSNADFMFVFGNTVVFLEVDEHQHEAYGILCDVQRMCKMVGIASRGGEYYAHRLHSLQSTCFQD